MDMERYARLIIYQKSHEKSKKETCSEESQNIPMEHGNYVETMTGQEVI